MDFKTYIFLLPSHHTYMSIVGCSVIILVYSCTEEGSIPEISTNIQQWINTLCLSLYLWLLCNYTSKTKIFTCVLSFSHREYSA